MSITATNNPYPESPDPTPSKLDKGGYEGTAKTLDNKIDEILAEALLMTNNLLTDVKVINGVTPTSAIPATGNIYTIVTTDGTYVNWNNLVVPVNSMAVLMRVDGVFSISQTPLDITSKVNVSDVVNNLTSTETAKPLSAAQGKILNENKASLISGKNKFNYQDTTNITPGYFQDAVGTIQTGVPGTAISHYIPIKAGQIIYSLRFWDNDVFHELTDINKENPVYVLATAPRTITATIDGFVRCSLNLGGQSISLVQIELGTSASTFESYTTFISKDLINEINESVIPETIARITDLDKKADLVAGKNKFNYQDTSIINPGYFESVGGGIQTGVPGTAISHYIPIKAGQTIYSLRFWDGAGVHHELTDINKLNPVYVPCDSTRTVTATIDGFVRCSFNLGGQSISLIQVELGTFATAFEDYTMVIDSSILGVDIARVQGVPNIITAKRYGTSGVDADFCGLNAIGDAINSVTDANAGNRYLIRVDGVFHFTNPSDFIYSFVPFSEPTILVSKKYVDVEGYGVDRTVISVDLAVGSSFPSGKTHMDYQPIMLTTNSKISNLSVIGKNCRYAIHSDNVDDNSISEVENCYIIHKGNSTINGGIPDGTTLGTGVGDNSKWIYKNCEIKSIESVFLGVHSAMSPTAKNGASVIFENCKIDGGFSPNYIANDLPIDLVFKNCKYSEKTRITYESTNWNNPNKYADYSYIKITADNPLLFSNSSLKGNGLRIKSKTTGLTSTITFDKTATAFDVIMGDSTDVVEISKYSFKKQFGYFYKAGGVGLNAVAISNIDVNEGGLNSLGKRLGNCSVTNKTLTVLVDGTSYDIIFNENFTSQNNAYVIAKIAAVIGTVADVDTYAIGREYYPSFDTVQDMKNIDSTTIKAGMGVIFTDSYKMRIALNSDNRVDAVCLDDTPPNTYGRTQRGRIYSSESGQRFSTLEVDTNAGVPGDEFGISPTQAGYFDRNATPKILRAYAEWNSLKFIN